MGRLWSASRKANSLLLVFLGSVTPADERAGSALLSQRASDGPSGGVLILSKEPLALTQVPTHQAPWGQILACEVLVCRIKVICGCRRPAQAVEEASTALTETFAQLRHRHWVMCLCLDWNMPNGPNVLADTINMASGIYVGGSGHQTSTEDIDTVWVSASLSAEKVKHMH